MTDQTKFYQVGSFAVGNRLVDPRPRTVQSDRVRTNALTSGHRACQGCGEALGARFVARRRDGRDRRAAIAVNATGCLEVFSTPYPETSWQVAWMHSLFGNAAAVATGVAAALKVKGRADLGSSPRRATGEPSTSVSAASRGCSNATTTSCSSATTTRPT